MTILIWLATNILAVGVAAWLVPGIRFTEGDQLADYWPSARSSAWSPSS